MKDGDAVARSDALDAELEGNPVVMNLVRISRQHSLLLKVLIGSLLFDFALSGAIFFLTVTTSHTADQASQAAKAATSAQTQAYNQCLASNDSRHTQLQLWEFILALPPDPNLTPEQRQRQQVESARFRRYVQKKLAPRDCNKLKPVRTKSGAFRFVPVPVQTVHPSPPPTRGSAGAPIEVAPRATSRPAGPPTRHPSSRPSSHPSSTHSPSPSPTPLLCVLGHCVPPHQGSATLTSSSSSDRSVPAAVAGGLLLVVCPCWFNCWRKQRVGHPCREQEHTRQRPRRRRNDASMQRSAAPRRSSVVEQAAHDGAPCQERGRSQAW